MIHWCGAGLSSGPGLRRLVDAGREVTVWEISREAALAALGGRAAPVQDFTAEALAGALRAGDVVVAMVPTDRQLPLASLAVTHGAHFVSSSYLSPGLRALGAEAREAGAVLLAEVGLDPGIDHLMAHDLVFEYRASPGFHAENALSFRSYCGGIPREPNALRYKFSWSPLGVLKALRAPARSIRHYTELSMSRPWEALGPYTAPLPAPELFEVYPNRDSLPYIAEYGFDPRWKVKEFERGTLRPNGWAEAWAPIFEEVAAAEGAAGEERLAALAEGLRQGNAYAEGEADRVVLCVSLLAEREGRAVFHKTWALDAWGDLRGSAMARLVSGMVALGAGAVLDREIAPGLRGAPSDPRLVRRWLEAVRGWAQFMEKVDHLKRRR